MTAPITPQQAREMAGHALDHGTMAGVVESLADQIDSLTVDRDEWKEATLMANAEMRRADKRKFEMMAERDALKAELGGLPEAQADLLAACKALTAERDGWISRELTHHAIRANLEDELVDAKEAKEDWLQRWRYEKSHGCPNWGSHLSAGTDLTCAHDIHGDAINELIKCRAERDLLKADAERYRWLRNQHWHDSDLCVVMRPKETLHLGAYCPSEGLLDAEIETARKAAS
jgi:hypothetical protein